MLYALLYPEELRGIILMGTGARLRVHPDFLKRCQEPGKDNAPWLEGQRKYFESVDSDIYQLLMRRAVEIGPGIELNDLRCCDRFDVTEQIHKIKLPTQVLCGSDDAMTPVKYANYLAQQIQGARQDIIKEGSHFVQLGKYHEVNAKIEQFLATLK